MRSETLKTIDIDINMLYNTYSKAKKAIVRRFSEMPRRFSAIEKRKWLELYNDGKTEFWIAEHEAHCDPRTVKKGIEEARREHDAHIAQIELLKEALRKHQDTLLGIIYDLLSALVVPPPNLQFGWQRDDTSLRIQLSGVAASHESGMGCTVTLNAKEKPMWELLREHLKRDRMWSTLAQWEEDLAAHLEARVALKRKAAALLEAKTGLKVDPTQITYIESFVVELFYQVALDGALGIPDRTNLEKNIMALGAGEVRYLNSLLARTADGAEEACRKHMLEAFKELQASPEATSVTATYMELHDSTDRARRVVEEISLLGLVTGQCRICRRLGIQA